MFGYPIDHRVGRFAEQLEIVVRLLRGEQVTLDGRYHRVRDAVLVPTPSRRVPVLVAAEGPRMIRLAARWADTWISAWYGPVTDGVRAMLQAVGEAMDEIVGLEPITPRSVERLASAVRVHRGG